MVRTGVVAGLQLRLCDGRLEGGVPQRRGVREVCLAALEVTQERPLGDSDRVGPDRRVQRRPVDGEAEPAPQVLERLLVDLGQQLAELDEVLPADRYLLLGVGLCR